MKRNIFIALIAVLFSVAVFNTLSKKNVEDVCLNQIGIATWAYGSGTESTGASWAGGTLSAIGGSAAGYGLAGAAGIIVVSNPIGWVIGGAIVGL
jgi:hypothetical protein